MHLRWVTSGTRHSRRMVRRTRDIDDLLDDTTYLYSYPWIQSSQGWYLVHKFFFKKSVRMQATSLLQKKKYQFCYLVYIYIIGLSRQTNQWRRKMGGLLLPPRYLFSGSDCTLVPLVPTPLIFPRKICSLVNCFKLCAGSMVYTLSKHSRIYLTGIAFPLERIIQTFLLA